ncbi:MAG: hypothetical protein ACRDF0_07570 [Candidatus Limnocylindria bacterium]
MLDWLTFLLPLVVLALLGDIAARLVRPRTSVRVDFARRALILAALLVAAIAVPPLRPAVLPLAIFLIAFLSGLDDRVEPVGPWWAFWKRAPVR